MANTPLLKAQTEQTKLPHVRTIGEILLEVARTSERAAELIEQDLAVPEMSLEACGKALKEYARKHQKGGCWACAVFGLDADNPAIKVILDFYKIPSAWHYQGMFIRVIDSVDEITQEGERQSNCVAGYAKRHANGKTVIFVLRKKDSPKTNWHTVELDPETLRVRQCRGYRNADAAPEANAFVKAWTAYLRAIKKEQAQKGRKIA